MTKEEALDRVYAMAQDSAMKYADALRDETLDEYNAQQEALEIVSWVGFTDTGTAT